eukprot:snap_masked-scaffold_13-processed-gene-8.62-mRNA-1 protein AED:1.00 eAED:1.00 QI:0/-1/0/0/-1/1/1/0/284
MENFLNKEFKFHPVLAISDIDGYNILFYSNYVKYNHRAAFEICHVLGSVGSCSIKEVVQMSFLGQVKWEDEVFINSNVYQVSINTHSLNLIILHEWVVDGRVANRSLITYKLVTKDNSIQHYQSSTLSRPQLAFIKQTSMKLPKTPQKTHQNSYKVFPDMIHQGQLSTATILDLFERARTEGLGGQKSLQSLKKDFNRNIIVGSILSVKFSEEKGIKSGENVEIKSYGRLESRNMCAGFYQEIVYAGHTLASYYAKLYLYDSVEKKCVPFTEKLIEYVRGKGKQ